MLWVGIVGVAGVLLLTVTRGVRWPPPDPCQDVHASASKVDARHAPLLSGRSSSSGGGSSSGGLLGRRDSSSNSGVDGGWNESWGGNARGDVESALSKGTTSHRPVRRLL